MKKKIFYILIGIIVLIVAYYLLSPLWRVKEVQDDLPLATPHAAMFADTAPLAGTFMPKAHGVTGEASVIYTENGPLLRFEDFYTVNGPDLRIYLSTDTNAKDFIDLGPIRGTKGDINYELPDGVDLEKYDTVLVWCRAFRTLFSYAELTP